jgi:hypothetical protein
MKSTLLPFLLCLELTIGCERKFSRALVKDHLERAMSSYLETGHGLGRPPQFQIMSVDYFEENDFYVCEFTVKLHRELRGDTVGIIKGRISKDFAKVTR